MDHSHPNAAISLEMLYDKIFDGIRAKDHYLARQPSEVSVTRLVPLTPAVWTSFQTAFIKCERMDLAANLWRDVIQLGIRPKVTMWTALLDAHAERRDSSQAQDVWCMMRREGVQPDALSYRALISVLFDERKPEEAMKVFGEYLLRFKDRNDSAILVYNTVLRGLLSHNRIAEVNSILAKMRLTGPKPNIGTYNILLGYYARLNDFKALANVVTTMSAVNISGDVATFQLSCPPYYE